MWQKHWHPSLWHGICPKFCLNITWLCKLGRATDLFQSKQQSKYFPLLTNPAFYNTYDLVLRRQNNLRIRKNIFSKVLILIWFHWQCKFWLDLNQEVHNRTGVMITYLRLSPFYTSWSWRFPLSCFQGKVIQTKCQQQYAKTFWFPFQHVIHKNTDQNNYWNLPFYILTV